MAGPLGWKQSGGNIVQWGWTGRVVVVLVVGDGEGGGGGGGRGRVGQSIGPWLISRWV